MQFMLVQKIPVEAGNRRSKKLDYNNRTRTEKTAIDPLYLMFSENRKSSVKTREIALLVPDQKCP